MKTALVGIASVVDAARRRVREPIRCPSQDDYGLHREPETSLIPSTSSEVPHQHTEERGPLAKVQIRLYTSLPVLITSVRSIR